MRTDGKDKEMIVGLTNGTVSEEEAKEYFGDDYDKVIGAAVALPHSSKTVDDIVNQLKPV